MATLAFSCDAEFSVLDFSFLGSAADYQLRDDVNYRLASNPVVGLTKSYTFEDIRKISDGPINTPDWGAFLLGNGMKLDLNQCATAGRMNGFMHHDYQTG